MQWWRASDYSSKLSLERISKYSVVMKQVLSCAFRQDRRRSDRDAAQGLATKAEGQNDVRESRACRRYAAYLPRVRAATPGFPARQTFSESTKDCSLQPPRG